MSPNIEAIAQTVIFLFSAGANPQPIGTAFLIGYPVPNQPNAYVPFVVTAKHVIGDESKILARYSRGDSLAPTFVEYDFKSLKESDDYFPHPDEGVDIAIFRTQSWKEFKTELFPVDLLATKDTLKSEYIGMTDRILFPGLLVNFVGTDRNYPVMRSGSIALIPEEKVPLRYTVGSKLITTQQEIILLNAVSIPGASGSPVLLDPGMRVANTSAHISSKPYLLGVMHGFYPASPREVSIVQTANVKLLYSDNSGIAIIFPAWRIKEIVDSPQFKARVEAILSKEGVPSADQSGGKTPPIAPAAP